MTYSTVAALSSPTLATLRSRRQWSRLYLTFFKPAVVYSARLSVVPSSTDMVVQLSFTGGSGTLANVFPDMTLYVGSTAGAYDLGVARIRKSPIAGTLYISEESDIDWTTVVSGGIYLTVVNEFDLWARHIRTVSDTEFYMDYDVALTDQNTNYDPIPIMGGHRVVKLVGSSVATYWNFSNSYVIGSTITGYSVACATASSITGSTTATPNIYFNTTGWHAIYLTVTAATGKTFRGVRYVYVYSSSAMPSTVFQLGSCSGDYQTGGWDFEATIHGGFALADVPERALCILFAEDFYDGTQTSIGQLAGCENIICVGKIAEERYGIAPDVTDVTIRVQGMQYWLQQTYAFPTEQIQTTSVPENWVRVQSLTVAKALYHLLRWGSTAPVIMDCYLPVDDTRFASDLVSPASNLWAQMQEIAFASMLANAGVDRFTRLFIEVEPQYTSVASRVWATVMTITDDDWTGSINMERAVVTRTGQIVSSGVVVTALDTLEDPNYGYAVFSMAPGHIFTHYGTPEVVDRLLQTSQLLSNEQAAMILAQRNNPFPSTEMELAENNRAVDCFPRQYVSWTLNANKTPRGFSVSGRFIPRRVELSWEKETGFLGTRIVIEKETIGTVSSNGDVPGSGDLSIVPDVPDYPKTPSFGDFIVVPNDLPGSIAGSTGPSQLIMHEPTLGMVYSKVWPPVWQVMNTGLTLGQAQSVNWVDVAQNGVVYIGRLLDNTPSANFIARAPSVGAPWVIQTMPVAVNQIWGIALDPIHEKLLVWVDEGGGTRVLVLGSNGSYSMTSAMGTIGSGSLSANGMSYGQNSWAVTEYNAIAILNNAATSGAVISVGLSPTHLRAGTTGKLWSKVNGSAGLVYSSDNGVTWIVVATSGLISMNDAGTELLTMDCDLTGQYVMGRWITSGDVDQGKGVSTDYGTTWLPLPNLPAGNWHFRYAGGVGTNSHWMAASGTQMKWSTNLGLSWDDTLLGNLLALRATPAVDIIRVVKY